MDGVKTVVFQSNCVRVPDPVHIVKVGSSIGCVKGCHRPWCMNLFTVTRKGEEYCSPECRRAALLEQKRNWWHKARISRRKPSSADLDAVAEEQRIKELTAHNDQDGKS